MKKKLKLIVFDFDGVFTNCNLKFRDVNCRDTFGLTYIMNKYKIGICTRSDGEHIPQIIIDRVDFVIKNCKSKYSEIMKLGFKHDEIAYIGDDTHDLECINKFKYSACPKDAHPEVLEKAKFVSSFDGGKGAVREFIDRIISHDGKITAIIPVRSGSTRCKNKNIRKFNNTNLLKLKIETLKKVRGIDKIMVSSNDDEMLEIAKLAGAIPVKRDPKYCTTLCSGSDMYCALAEAVDTDIMLYTHCVCPFVSVETYENMINIWKNNMDYDSIMTAHELKEYLWYNNKPLNYDFDNAPPSQTINGYYIPTFGACIVKKKFVLKNRNIIGFKPYFYQVNQLESIDIDTPLEFYSAELLHKENISNIEQINNKINNDINNNKLELLDCTIRDGGYINNWNFTDKEVIDMYKTVSQSGFDYFEIGFRTDPKKLQDKGKWCYSTDNDIKNIIEKYNGCKIAVMAKVGTVNIDNFVKPASSSNVKLVRVLIPHNNDERFSIIDDKLIKDTHKFIRDLVDVGYEVSINFACFHHVTNEELDKILLPLSDIKIKSIYIADTYGSITPDEVEKQICRLTKYNIPVGLHFHNFNNDALAKLKEGIKNKNVLMIDSCINGMGRGLGNLKSEDLMMELNLNYEKMFDFSSKHFNNKKELLYKLSSNLDIHPNFCEDLLKKDIDILNCIKILKYIKKYTENINKRNYDSKLIDQYISSNN